MISKALYVSLCLLAFGTQANAHALIAPALGVEGKGARSDVQRPSSAKPCGKSAVSALATSSFATADAQGNIPLTITNFNAGGDGSRKIKKVQVDPTGTGKSFVAADVVTNGDAAPKGVGSDSISVKLPPGTKCTGAGGLCLMSLTTTAGFGNCIAVKQADAVAGTDNVGNAPAAKDAKGAVSCTANAAGADESTATKNSKGNMNATEHSGFRDPAVKVAAMKADKRTSKPAGARAARAYLSSAGEELTKRSGVFSWIWA